MKTNKEYSKSTASRLNAISEEELEDVLFTFLGEVHKERMRITGRRKKKYLELLAQLGPVEAERFLDTLAGGLLDEQVTPNSSPMVGEVIRKYMEVQTVSGDELAKKLNAAVASIDGLLKESYRVPEDGIKDILTSLALKHKIGNQTILRHIVATGYRLFALKPSTVGPVRIAARKKHK